MNGICEEILMTYFEFERKRVVDIRGYFIIMNGNFRIILRMISAVSMTS